jgi:hypothetical protein
MIKTGFKYNFLYNIKIQTHWMICCGHRKKIFSWHRPLMPIANLPNKLSVYSAPSTSWNKSPFGTIPWCFHRRSWHGLTPPPFFSNFLFTNLFTIKFLYFFIISSLFSYFNLFVSISIQSHVNNNLHVSTLYRYYYY